jgi:hypothetical protein
MPTFASNNWVIGRGHLSLMFLSELSYEIGIEGFGSHLAIILHLLFLGLDNAAASVYDIQIGQSPVQPVHEHSRCFLLNLLSSLNDLPEDITELKEFLKCKEGKPLWAHEDISIEKPTIKSAKELSMFVTRIASVVAIKYKDVIDHWSNEGIYFLFDNFIYST